MGKVLLIDDDPMMEELMLPVLKALGMGDIIVANEGKEALDIIDEEAETISLILCDLRMPGMDGIEFLRHLGAREYAGEVIIISGTDVRLLESVYDLGVAHKLSILGALEKPVTTKALAEVLKHKPKKSSVKPEHDLSVALDATELARALRAGEIVSYFQPKVDIATHSIDGVETLVRWHHPDYGVVFPDRFIPMAEESGIIEDLTETVFYQAMRYAAAWQRMGLDLNVAVNVSVHNLQRLDLPETLMATASTLDIDPSVITIEVTESRLMQNLTSALEILSRLYLQGVKLSIDDFGTGYSSMEQLRRIPFHELKIDRSFISRAEHDTAAMAILESSVELGKKLNMTLVAEGVETREQWNMVEELGCNKVQGFFVSKAIIGNDIPGWISSWEKVKKLWH